MIEHSGFSKGRSNGGARISKKHVLALVNAGDATAHDILELARAIQTGVHERAGILLEPEPRLLGFSRDELGSLAATAPKRAS